MESVALLGQVRVLGIVQLGPLRSSVLRSLPRDGSRLHRMKQKQCDANIDGLADRLGYRKGLLRR